MGPSCRKNRNKQIYSSAQPSATRRWKRQRIRKTAPTLKVLCGLWTNLANECLSMTDAQVGQEIAVLERIHAGAFGAGESKAAE